MRIFLICLILLFGCPNTKDIDREDLIENQKISKDTKEETKIYKSLHKLQIFSKSYPAHYEKKTLGSTHAPVYRYRGRNLYISMPIENPWMYNHKPDVYLILRYKKANLESLIDLEQIIYIPLPESIEYFKAPKIEKGYTYLIVTKYLLHDMWATILKKRNSK